MYEGRTHYLLAWPQFLRRAAGHVLVAVAILSCLAGINRLFHWLHLEPPPGG